MRRTSLYMLLALSIILLTTACSSSNSTKDVSQTLAVDLSTANVSQNMDSHGGFHGDGAAYLEMTFTDEEQKNLLEDLKNNTAWSNLPLSDNLNVAVYGKENESETVGPFVTDDKGNALFPLVENGYYFFLDRHNESKNTKEDTDLLSRNSFNFTIAIYDIDKQTLYYSELDT